MSALRTSQRNGLRRVLNVLLFVPLFAGTYAASYLVCYYANPERSHWPTMMQTIGWVVLIKLGMAMWFQLHRGWRHYVTFHDVLVLVQAVSCSSIGITLVDSLLLTDLTIPRLVILIDWDCTLLAVGGMWAVPRLLRDGGWNMFSSPEGTPALIVGVTDNGEGLLRAIRKMPNLAYYAVGFVDDRPQLQGRNVSGVPVLGTTDHLAQLVKTHGAEEVLITAGELPGKQVRQLVETSHKQGFRVKVLPSFEQLLRERVAVQPRPVIIEDLLRRQSVDLDMDAIRQWLYGKTLLVTGSAGSIGSEICRQLLQLEPASLVLLDRAETGQFFVERELQRIGSGVAVETCVADITDRPRMDAVFRQYRPDVVFHAAAYKHVPLMESHPGEAIKNITLATRHLVDLAQEHEAGGLVMISTDKAVNPTSIMGTCKRLAEQYVQARAADSRCRLVTVRFGNVLDSAGSVIPIFREQIARGGPVTVTHPKMIRYFMLIPEAAQLVIQAGAMGRGGEIFVLDMGEPVRIVDLAKDMIRLSGLRLGEDIEIDFVGLRPGEKLFEELYGDGENHDRTSHPKIMVARGPQPNLFQINQHLRQLEKVVDMPPDVVCRALREILPPAKPAAAGSMRRAA